MQKESPRSKEAGFFHELRSAFEVEYAPIKKIFSGHIARSGAPANIGPLPPAQTDWIFWRVIDG